ncbi:MAG: 6-bladed beta-propeller [Bacteroidota bacterium]|nr:6-bladed beta-propeller [Bacteroidota bacterium]
MKYILTLLFELITHRQKPLKRLPNYVLRFLSHDSRLRPEDFGGQVSRGLKYLLFTSLFLIGCGTTKETIPEYIWPSPPEQPRFKLVNIIKGEDYFTKSKSDALLSILAGESKENALVRPFGVTADATGTIYVTDTSLKNVVIFDNQIKKMRSIGDKGQQKLHTPIGVIVTPENNIIVSDSFLKRIFVFDTDGNVIRTFGSENQFGSPTGIAYEPKLRRLYIVDTNKHYVIVIDDEGNQLFTFGERGGEDGQFNFPTNITIAYEKIYIIDTFNGRIQIFDLDGKFLSKFGQLGNTPGHFARPKGIAIDSDKNIYVTDAAFDNFQIFNEKGETLMFIGNSGIGAGEFHLPAGIFIDQNNLLYVVDQLNARIQIFKYIIINK